jgi:hypothetical protein
MARLQVICLKGGLVFRRFWANICSENNEIDVAEKAGVVYNEIRT